KMNRTNVFAIEMDGGAVVKSDHRESLFGRWLDGITTHLTAFLEALPHIFVRDNWGFGAELHIPTGVIAMKMRIEYEFNRLIRDLLQSLFNFRRERGELVINQNDPVSPD